MNANADIIEDFRANLKLFINNTNTFFEGVLIGQASFLNLLGIIDTIRLGCFSN